MIGLEPKGDLGNLVRTVPERYLVVKSVGHILSRLHSRGKSSEQERQTEVGNSIRDVSYDDAELAVSLAACLIREFHWSS